jgi:hypothetical protein
VLRVVHVYQVVVVGRGVVLLVRGGGRGVGGRGGLHSGDGFFNACTHAKTSDTFSLMHA